MASDKQPLAWRVLHTTKRGQGAEDYEDAFAFRPRAGRFAVADGVSESSFAALWAHLLVKDFAHRPRRLWTDDAWLAPLRNRWAKRVDHLELPWYAEAKREQGAFATFLGVALTPARDNGHGRWRAWAIGDSCLFRIRHDRLLRPFPVTCADDFGNHPALVGSRSGDPAKSQRRARGRCLPGDRFFLMTDALAQWFLRQTEADAKPWHAVAKLLNEPDRQQDGDYDPDRPTDFSAWIDSLRDQESLRNDDVTLLVVDVL